MLQKLSKRLAHASATVPDISNLPGEALLTRSQLSALTGFTGQTLGLWARVGRGPAVIYVEGRPRTTVRAYREWVQKAQSASLTGA